MTSAEFEEKKTTSLFHPRSIQAFSKMITNTAAKLATFLYSIYVNKVNPDRINNS